MSYAMMVDEYNELIRGQVSQSEEAEESGISNEMDSKLQQWKERADEYSHKFTALAEGGIGELAGMSGLKNTYSKFTETRKKFKKFMGDGENASQVNPTGTTTDPGQVLDTLTNLEESDLIPQGSKDVVGSLVNAVKSVKQKVVDTVSRAPDLARATLTDPTRAGAVAVKESSVGDVNLSADDLDDIVRRNLADVNEGVGREAGALVENVHGINYGKTGAGADLIADAQQSTSFSAPANLRSSLRAVEGEVGGAVKTTPSAPIDVGRIGVKATAKEFDARTRPPPALAEGIMQQGPSPPSALDLQIQSAQEKLKDTFKQLPPEDRQRVIRAQGRGELPQESLEDLQSLQSQFDERLSGLAQQRAGIGDFLGGIEQGGKSVTAGVQATKDVKPPSTEIIAGQDDASRGAVAETNIDDAVRGGQELVSAGKEAVETAGDIGKTALKEGVESIGEKIGAEELAGSTLGVVGEAIASVGGIFTAVDGLIHLFHHKQSAMPQVRSIGNMAPEINTSVTSKFSSAIPTVDSAQEVSGAIASF